MRSVNVKDIIVKVEEQAEETEKEDVFHLDDDITKDYLKGKDEGLVLEDRYERRRRKKKK